MRLTAVFLLVTALQVSARSISQIITLQEQDAPLDKVFKKIEKQTGYTFVYRDQLLKQARRVTIDTKSASLEKVLELCFKDQPLSYSIVERTIVVSAKENRVAEYGTVLPPPVIIKGRVVDIGGKPLAGVSVTISGQSKGTSTNADGEFSITVDSKDAILGFTYVGKQTQRIPVGNSFVINVIMVDVDSQLEEVVVSGYGIRENRANQVGSAAVVGAKDLERKPVDRIDRLLEGLVPGLQYQLQDNTNSSARPRFETRIRGEGSVSASGDPLWIVDGVPLYTGNESNAMPGMNTSISPLTYLNPNDIESVSILKDASATTIYGANGSNGVIFITTKKGAVGKDVLTYNFRTGINQITSTKFQVLNGDEYRMLVHEAAANAGKFYPFVEEIDTVSTDWYDLFFRTGRTTQHNLSLSGGDAKTKYFISGAYFTQKLTTIENKTDRLSLRLNIDHQFNKRLSVAIKMGTSYNSNKLFTPNSDYYNYRPNINPYNPDGTFATYDYTRRKLNTLERDTFRFFNSLAEAYENDDDQTTFATTGSIGVTLKIIDGLTLTSTNGIDFYSMKEDIYYSSKNWSGKEDGGEAQKYQNNYLKWISINHANYNKVFGLHEISAVAGLESQADRRSSVSATGFGFANDDLREVSFAAEANRRGASSREKNTALSLLARGSYTYDRRYTLSVNFRRDGNSRFGDNVRWAEFSSVGAAWNISNELFWKSNFFDNAKLKFSIGNNGNARIPNESRGYYELTDIDYNGRPGGVFKGGENPDLSWEQTQMINTGLDIRIAKRVLLSVELYQNTTKDLIDEIEVSRTTGQRRTYRNLGSMRNKGIEISVNSTNIQTRDFKWETRVNVSKNRNRVLSLYNDIPQSAGLNTRTIGADVTSFYLVRWAGVDPLDGAARWLDAKGNLTKTINQATDRVLAGSSTPDFYGGMTNTVTYKGISLSALLNFSVGGYYFSSLRRNSEDDGLNIGTINQSKNILDRWQNPGDLALTPKLQLGVPTGSSLNSTRFLHNKTNLRLNNVSINYGLPQTLLKRIKVQNLSVYLQADNVALWTPYENNSERNTYRNSFYSYPLERTWSFGLTAGF